MFFICIFSPNNSSLMSGNRDPSSTEKTVGTETNESGAQNMMEHLIEEDYDSDGRASRKRLPSRRHTLDDVPSHEELRELYHSYAERDMATPTLDSPTGSSVRRSLSPTVLPNGAVGRRSSIGSGSHMRTESALSAIPPGVPRLVRSKTDEGSVRSLSSMDDGWATPRTSASSARARSPIRSTAPSLRSYAGREWARDRDSPHMHRRDTSTSSSSGERASTPMRSRLQSSGIGDPTFGSARMNGEVNFYDRRRPNWRQSQSVSPNEDRNR